VRSFIGLCGFYQRCVPRFQHLAEPITSLLHKDQPWHCDAAEQKTFTDLQHALLTQLTLAYPDTSQHFVLNIDASDVALGATLSQIDESGALRLVACSSRKFKPAQRSYHTQERELLALVDSLKRASTYTPRSMFAIHQFDFSFVTITHVRIHIHISTLQLSSSILTLFAPSLTTPLWITFSS